MLDNSVAAFASFGVASSLWQAVISKAVAIAPLASNTRMSCQSPYADPRIGRRKETQSGAFVQSARAAFDLGQKEEGRHSAALQC